MRETTPKTRSWSFEQLIPAVSIGTQYSRGKAATSPHSRPYPMLLDCEQLAH